MPSFPKLCLFGWLGFSSVGDCYQQIFISSAFFSNELGKIKAKQDVETDFPSDLYKNAYSEHGLDCEFFSLPFFMSCFSSPCASHISITLITAVCSHIYQSHQVALALFPVFTMC